MTKAEVDAVSSTVGSGMLASGRQVRRFEQLLTDRVGRECVVVGSGSQALALAVRVMLSRQTVRVVALPTYTCPAVLQAVERFNLGVRFVDATPRSFAPLFAGRADLAISVHTYGVPCPSPIRMPVIEDAAQAIGAELFGRSVGQWGDLAIMSFRAPKPVSCGQGGAVFGDHDAIAQIRQWLDYDDPDTRHGFNDQMTDIEASIGIAQLERLDEMLAKRKAIAEQYVTALPKGLAAQTSPWGEPNRFRFVIVPPRDHHHAWRKRFDSARIEVTNPLEPDELLHRRRGQPDSGYPTAADLARRTISLPIHPSMAQDDVDRVCEVLSACE